MNYIEKKKKKKIKLKIDSRKKLTGNKVAGLLLFFFPRDLSKTQKWSTAKELSVLLVTMATSGERHGSCWL